MGEDLNTKEIYQRDMWYKKTVVDAIVFLGIVATTFFYTFSEAPLAAFISFVIAFAATWFRRDIYMVLDYYGNPK